MNAPSQTLICNPQIEWSKLLSVSFLPFRVSSHLPCLCEYVPRLIVKKKHAESRRKKKKRKKREKTSKLNCQDSTSRFSAHAFLFNLVLCAIFHLDCLQSAFSLKICLVLDLIQRDCKPQCYYIGIETRLDLAYALVSRGKRLRRSRD